MHPRRLGLLLLGLLGSCGPLPTTPPPPSDEARPGAQQPVGPLTLEPHGSVFGTVLQADGTPAPYAAVELYVHPTRQIPGTVDDQGRFEISRAPTGSFTVDASPDPMGSAYVSVEIEEGRASGPHEIRLPGTRRRITGTVRAHDGSPLPGIVVRGHGECLSGDDGAFELWHTLDPEEATMRLAASDPEHRIPSTRAENVPGDASGVTLVMPEAVPLEIRLVGAGDLTAPELWVYESSRSRKLRVDDEGAALTYLPRGPFTVAGKATGYRKTALPAGDSRIDPKEVAGPLRLELEPGDCVRGRVVHEGRPISGARVSLHSVFEDGRVGDVPGFFPSGLTSFVEDNGPKGVVTTDAEGTFVLGLGSTARRVGVRVEPPEGPVTWAGPFEWEEGAHIRGLEVDVPRGGSVEGSVLLSPELDPTEVVIGLSNGNGLVHTRRLTPEGTYRFDDLHPGAWQVRICPDDYPPLHRILRASAGEPRPWDCTVASDRTTPFDLDARAHGTCRLFVTVPDGYGVPFVSLSPTDGSRRTVQRRVFDHVYVYETSPGTYDLEVGQVSVTDGCASIHTHWRDTLPISPGRQEWSPPSAWGEVELRTSGDRYHQPVTYEWSSGNTHYERTLHPARKALSRHAVPAGLGTVRRSQKSYRIDVPEGGVVEVDLRE